MLGFQGGVSIPLVKGGVKAPPAKRQCRAGPKAGARRGFTLFRPAQVGPSLRQPGSPRLGGPPPPWSPTQSDLRIGTAPQSTRRPSPPPTWLQPFPVELSGTRGCARPPD